MIKEINGFMELNPPLGSEGYYFVRGDDPVYLLNGGRYAVCNLDDITFNEIGSNLYFKTEWDCHYAASEYYHKHGLDYPYMVQWSNCTWNPEQITNDSQKMEFV